VETAGRVVASRSGHDRSRELVRAVKDGFDSISLDPSPRLRAMAHHESSRSGQTFATAWRDVMTMLIATVGRKP
jgi:hypothetical protein